SAASLSSLLTCSSRSLALAAWPSMSYSLAFCAAVIFSYACCVRRCAAAMFGWRIGLTLRTGLAKAAPATRDEASRVVNRSFFMESSKRECGDDPARPSPLSLTDGAFCPGGRFRLSERNNAYNYVHVVLVRRPGPGGAGSRGFRGDAARPGG